MPGDLLRGEARRGRPGEDGDSLRSHSLKPKAAEDCQQPPEQGEMEEGARLAREPPHLDFGLWLPRRSPPQLVALLRQPWRRTRRGLCSRDSVCEQKRKHIPVLVPLSLGLVSAQARPGGGCERAAGGLASPTFQVGCKSCVPGFFSFSEWGVLQR